MSLPNRLQAQELLEHHVKDSYQRYHANMVATAMQGYAELFGEDKDLYYLCGYLHDLDFEQYPDEHPGVSLKWFEDWGYPADFIHAVEAHAYGYNTFKTLPANKLAASLLACDEICGIFFAYQKVNPIPYHQMQVKSIKKRIKEKAFAAKIDRHTIYLGCEHLNISLDEHIANLIFFFKKLDSNT
jgi:predicted hydrolase (HD superfamily)